LSSARPQKLTTELAGEAQLLITMDVAIECPYVPGLRRDDWPLDDPKGQPSNGSRDPRRHSRSRGGPSRAREREINGQFSLQAGGTIVRAVDRFAPATSRNRAGPVGSLT
jgi:hypothetical protein